MVVSNRVFKVVDQPNRFILVFTFELLAKLGGNVCIQAKM